MGERPKIDWDRVKIGLLRSEKILNKERSGSRDEIVVRVNACLERARSLAEPKSVTVEKAVLNNRPGAIELEGGVVLSTKYISSCLRDATRLNIFLVTVGKNIEEAATLLMKEGEELNGYLLDRIGSLAAESLAEDTEENLRASYASRHMSVSTRFSPGYCDWPIEEQFKLAKAIDFSAIGVIITKNCMMVPRKSISAVVGIGPEGSFSKKRSQCGACDKSDCDYRREL